MPSAIIVEEVSEKATDEQRAPQTTETAMMGIHYACGTSLAVDYCNAAEKIPAVTIGAVM